MRAVPIDLVLGELRRMTNDHQGVTPTIRELLCRATEDVEFLGTSVTKVLAVFTFKLNSIIESLAT